MWKLRKESSYKTIIMFILMQIDDLVSILFILTRSGSATIVDK